jgi:hypothetical protein
MPLESVLPNARCGTPSSVVALVGAFMALGYVLPNHAPPWMSFWQESSVATALALLATATLLFEQRGSIGWRWPGLLVIPPIQFLSGLIPFLQTAWMPSLYLLGLLLALLTGAALERREPSLVLWLLLASVWLAAIVSVALQLYQWLALQPGVGTLWVYRAGGGRPAANLGQPNSLSTVIVLALLATYWLWRRTMIGASVAVPVAGYLLVGLALTQSRTGLLNALIVSAALLLWHRRRPAPGLTLSVLGLVIFLFAAFAGYSAISRHIGLPLDADLVGRAGVGSRPLAWRMFVEGILQRPVVGHGWGRSFLAQMNGALDHSPLHEVFLSAHNVLLELAFWSGLPMAVAFAVGLALWLQACARRIANEASMLLLLFVAVVLVHAMLEYPLAYAYFLLPVGLAAGALSQRVDLEPVCRSPAWVAAGLLVVATVAFGITARDYLRVEQSYRDLLYEKARIQSDIKGSPPDVVVLSSLRELIVFTRFVPRVGMSEAELSWMADVVSTHPGAAGFAKVALALALNGKAAEAQKWVDTLCSIFAEVQCAALAAEWSTTAERYPTLRVVVWP